MPFRSLPFPLALLLSLLLHATIFAALVFAIRPSDLMGSGESVALSRTSLAPEAPPEMETIQLGIADGAADSRTWIGYSTAEEHLAPKSEVEQAAFEDEPEGGAAGSVPTAEAPFTSPGVASQEPSAATATQPPREIAPPVTEEATTAPPVEPTTPPQPPVEPPVAPEPPPPTPTEPEAAEPMTPGQEPPLPEVSLEGSEPPQPQTPPTIEEIAAMLEALLPSRQILDRWAPAPMTAAPPQEQAPSSDPATSSPVEPQPPAVNAESGSSSSPTESAPGPPRERRADGDPSDRESDATSTIDVPPDQWRRGKPLAARGLDIKTKRPVFPELTSLTARPVNPVVEIFFDRRGVPRRVNLLRGSGDARVDGPVVDAIYRWRASGAELSRLEGEELFRLEMRILLGN